MQPHEPIHPDVSGTPVLTGQTRVRDARSGATTTMDAWVDAHAAAEHRERDECVEAFVNAVARGDLVVVAEA